jgi:hypothetical protein
VDFAPLTVTSLFRGAILIERRNSVACYDWTLEWLEHPRHGKLGSHAGTLFAGLQIASDNFSKLFKLHKLNVTDPNNSAQQISHIQD